MTDKKITLIIFSLIILIPILSTLASANLLEEVLAPFETTDFSVIYDSYYSIIDFIIYTILFIGLAQVALSKHFDSRGGKAVVVAIGLVLAISLTISESVLGFNLRSFGPLAATIIIFLVGFVIFLGIKSAGMEIVGAGSITLVLTYFSIRSVSPSFFDWMISNQYLSWLHSVIFIAVLISIYKIFRLFISKKEGAKEYKSDGIIKNNVLKSSGLISHLKEEKDELNFMKKKLEKITNEAGKDSKQIINDLEEIKKIIHEFGNSQNGKELIVKKIKSLLYKEKEVHLRIQSLQEMVQRISNFDIKNFEKISDEYKSLPPNKRKKMEKIMQAEWKKLDVEKQMLKLEEAIIKYDELFRYSLELIIVSLESNKTKSSIDHIDEAIKSEKKLAITIRQILKLEKRIVYFTKKSLTEFSKV